MSGLPEGLLVCHGVVRLDPSNKSYIIFHSRDVGFTRRLLSCHGAVKLGLPDMFIIITITTTPIDVEGREVGCPTVYDGYMVRYIAGSE